ncbi:MAG: DMT family transporter [Planctomycetota bacterium]
MSTRSVLRSELALLGVVVIWGVNFVVMKVALGRADPFLFNATRFTISVALLAALHCVDVRRGRSPLLPSRDLVRPVLLLGLTGHVVYQIGFVLGLDRTTAGTASLLIASSPIWTGFVAHLGGQERLGARSWAGLLVAFAGTATVAAASSGVSFGREAAVGNALCVAAAFGWGCYTAWSRPYLARASSTAMALWTMVVSLPALWGLATPAIVEGGFGDADRGFWLAALYAGGLGTGIAYVLWNVGIQGMGPARTAASTCIVPVIAVAIGATVLGEPVSGLQAVGGAIVLGGLVMMGRAKAGDAAGRR